MLDWGIPVDEIPSVAESDAVWRERSNDPSVAPPPGVMRFVNAHHDPTGGRGKAA